MTAGTHDMLPQAVRRTTERLRGLVEELDKDAARWIGGVEQRAGEAATVVVVGETNRGKSTLVNALLASPGLSPVEAEVTTSTYLVFGYGEHPVARACYPGRYEPVRFDPAELPAWTSASRDLPEGQLPPRYVEVDADIPLLQRLRLVDTPGVGGLNSMHGELAAEAAAAATALLFVVDASTPFTAGELEFLHGVGSRVETVIFALTKTDAFRGWRQILDDDRKLLAEHAPRFADAPFLPVSARMFEMAGTARGEQAAVTLRERSGVAALQVELQQRVVGRSVMLAHANVLRALSTALSEQEVRLSGQRRALAAGESEAKRLRARRDELATARRSSTRGWQVKLRGEIQHARVESNHDVARQVRDLQSWFRQAIESADSRQLAALPSEVDAALGLVSGRISAALSTRLATVTESVLAELFTSEELRMLRSQVARGTRAPVELRAPERRNPTAEDKLLVFLGMAGGFGAARIAALPAMAGAGLALANPFILVPTIVVGLGAGWWMARTRKRSSEKQQLKQWLTEAIADARGTLDQTVSEQLISAEQQLSLALDEALERRIEALEAELKDVDKSMKLADGERQRRLAELDGRLSAVAAGREKAGDLLRSIRSLANGTDPAYGES